MKKLFVALLAVALTACSAIGLGTIAFADGATEISTAEQLLAMEAEGNYVLTQDITLASGEYVAKFAGTLDGNGHTVTVNNSVGLIGEFGKMNGNAAQGVVKNLTVAGTVKGTGRVAAVANHGVGTIENVKVTADVSSTANQNVAGFANANGKNPIKVINSQFEGTVNLLQGFTSASNYAYWGMFLGYNGGAFGGGSVVNSTANYTFTIPTAEVSKIDKIEYFNVNGDKTNSVESSYTTKEEGDRTIYSFKCVVNMDPVTVASVNDEGIMANYGSPVVRFTLKDGSYRYIDGFDKANARFITEFETDSFNSMYAYKDISYLTMEKISEKSVSENVDGNVTEVTSTYSVVTVNTEEEFESFARIINSAIPAKFIDKETNQPTELSILNTLATSVKLGADIVLDGDANGNASQFYGLGKQEFFPYRGGINGDGHSLTVNIDAPNGYCIGIISVVSEMAEDIKVENLTVNGTIKGRTKVGIVGYFDMVCNNYINGGNIKFKNVTNNASVTGYTGVGGLLGTVSCTNDAIKAFVEGCENNGDITLLENGKYAGGIVGCAGFYQKSGVDIKDSANNGNVTAKAGASYVGGIAGYISDNLSSVQNVENTGDVTAVNGVYGDYIGYTGALRTDITAEGAIGEYKTTVRNNIKSVSFKNTEMASTYGNAYQIFLSKSITPNYKINLTFKNNATGELFQFTRRLDDGTTETYTEREMNDLGYYSVILDPAEYTVSAIVRNNDEYFNSGVIGEDGLVLAATATYTVSKKALNYTFANVTTPYTGEAVDYFTALESASGYDKESHKIPDTSAETGAKWVVTYTLNGNAVTSTAAPGTYQVSIKLDATDKFASRYEYSAETYNVEMVVKALITVTVDSIEITQGENATFTVTVKTYDGSEFTNLEALGLTFSVKGFGSQTSVLPAGTHTVTVTGAATVDGADVEYVSGTLTVKAKTQNPTSSSSAAQGGMGCGLDMGASLMGGIALVAAAFAAIRSRKH